MIETLLPCPFCGSDQVSKSQGHTADGKPWFYIECEACAATAEPGLWNRRASQPSVPHGWAVKRVGDAIHIEHPNGQWCGYMLESRGGPAHGLTYYFLNAMLAAAPTPPADCTCPSGDGSLRFPCSSHPPAARQAQPIVDWEAMYDQMCERCESMDKKLAEYEAQQDADKVAAHRPWYKSLGGEWYPSAWDDGLPPEWRLDEVSKHLEKVRIEYAYEAAQPDPAMAGNEISDEELFTIHDEYFPTIVLGHEKYLRFARALLKRVQPASGEDAK